MTIPFGLLSPELLAQFGPGLPGMTPSRRLAPPQLAMPRIPAPTLSPAGHASLLDRIKYGLSQVPEKLMPVPKGLEGLLSPEDLKSARGQGLLDIGLSLLGNSQGAPGQSAPGLGQALAQGIQAGRAGFGQGVNGALQASQLAEAQQQKQRLEASRAQVAQVLAPVPGESPEQRNERILGAWNQALAAGDLDTAHAMTAAVQQLLAPTTRAAKKPIEVRLGDHVEFLDPDTMQPIASKKIGPSPRDPNAPDTAQQLRDQRMFTREQQLADDYNKDTKTQRETYTKIQGAVAEAPRAMQGDGAAQVNMLYAFVSAMDPASAVREGEIGLAQSATPVWQQASAMLQKYTSGQSVTVPPGMIQKMAELMKRKNAGYAKYVNERARYYGKRAQHWGVGSEGLFPGLDDALPSSAPSGAMGNAAAVRQFLKK